MRNKLSVVLLVLFLAGIFTASICNAADYNRPRTTFHVDRAPKFAIPFERDAGVMVPNKGMTQINLNADVPPTNSPGNRAGLTYYDYQHNGSMGRQLATNQSNGYVFIVWMAQDDTVIPGARYIAAQAYDAWGTPPDYLMDPGGKEVTEDYSGYTSCAFAPNGATSLLCHTNPGTDIYKSTWYYDGMPNFFIYNGIEECTPDPEAPWYEPETIWPIVGVHDSDSSNVTEDVVYALTHVFEGSEDMILYRGTPNENDSIKFDDGQYIETVTDLSYTIAPDANSDAVIIAYTDDRTGEDEGDGGQTDLDVWCMLSSNQGLTWGPPINVSNYSEDNDSLWRAYSDLSTVITPDGKAHLIAPVR